MTDPTLPECIGPYRITRLLGEGGMGVVYAAEQEEPVRRTVALKLVLIVSRSLPTSEDRFTPDSEVARTSLEMEPLDGAVRTLEASIQTSRSGPDTVGFVDRSTPVRRITGMVIRPATHSTLVFLAGRWRLTVPIAAR